MLKLAYITITIRTNYHIERIGKAVTAESEISQYWDGNEW